MTWTVLARSPGRTVTGILHAWELELTLRRNEVGAIKLSLPAEATPAGWPAPGAGVIVLRDQQVVASGEIDQTEYAWSADPSDENAGAGTYTLEADTDLARLGYRITYPTPGRGWGQQSNNHYVYPPNGKASASTVMRVLVNQQAGSLAPTARHVPGLRLAAAPTTPGRDVRVSARFEPLLQVLRDLAAAGGDLTFDVVDTLDGRLDFSIGQARDLSHHVRLRPEHGTITAFTLTHTAPTATIALVAGRGQAADRDLVQVADNRSPDPAWGRRETFVDQRQVAEDDSDQEQHDQYEQAGRKALSEARATSAITATIRETPTLRWPRDVHLGDRISIATPAGTVTDQIHTIEAQVRATGDAEVTLHIGNDQPASSDPLTTTVADLAARVAQLEHT